MSKNSPKPYSEKAITWSTVLGGPLAAGYLIGQNFKFFKQPTAAKKALWIGVGSTVAILLVLLLLPTKITDKIPNFVIPAIYVPIISHVLKTHQGEKLKKHTRDGGTFNSGWKAFGVSLVSLLLMAAVFIGGYMVLPVNPDDCVVDESQKGKELYDQYEAACFIYLQSEGSLNWDDINEVLTQEYEYQLAEGLVEGSTIEPKEGYNPVPFIFENNTRELDTATITNVLEIELDYLRFIGVVIEG